VTNQVIDAPQQGSPAVQRRGQIVRVLETVAYGLVLGVLLWLVTRIFRNNLRWFDDGWDFLAYHLPFGIKLFQPDLIRLSPHLEELYLGSPLLFSWLIGLVWKLHPLLPLNAMHMLGLAAWAASLPVIYAVVGRQVLIFAALSLAAPLVLIHTMSGYVDLPANVFTLLLLVSVFKVQSNTAKAWAWASLAIVSLGVMGASKFTVMPLALVGALVFATVIYRNRTFSQRTKLLLMALGLLAASSWGLRNVVMNGNPVYPLKPPVIGHLVPYTWTLPANSQDWPPELLGVAQPLVTLASIFEVSTPEQIVPLPRYQVDQSGSGPGTAGYRMGGFGWPVMATGVTVIALALRRKYIRLNELAPFLVLTTTTLFLPQSHELRYSLYIPLMLAFLVALVARRCRDAHERLAIACACLVVCAWSLSNNSIYVDKRTRPLERLAVKEGIDLSALTKAPIYCGRGVGAKLVFLTGPTLRERRAVWSGEGRPCPVDGIEVVGTWNW
jgi:hypothetical protein